MKKTVRDYCCAFCLGVAVAACGRPAAQPADSAQSVDTTVARAEDRTISLAVADLSASEAERRSLAAERLADMGAAAVPALPALTAALDDPDDQVCVAVVRAIGAIGPSAVASVPKVLRRITQSVNVDRAVCWGVAEDEIRRIGSGTIPFLVAALGGPDRDAAAGVLAGMNAAVPVLVRERHDSRIDARTYAGVFGQMGPAAAIELIPLLDDQDAGTRTAAVEALGAMGPAAAAAVPTLQRLSARGALPSDLVKKALEQIEPSR